MEDWYFNTPPYKALLDYAKKTNSVFWMPRVVLEELRGKFTQELESKLASLIKSEREIYRQINSPKESHPIVNAQQEAERYIKHIFKKLKITKKNIIDYPEDAMHTLVQKAVNRTKPFTAKGEEFRDALLWENVIDTVLEPSHAEYVAFISNDSSAFGNLLQKGKEEELHPHLRDEMVRRIEEGLVLSDENNTPSKFYENNFGYFRKVSEFIGIYHTSVASISKNWLKKQLVPTEVYSQLVKFANENESFQKQINKFLQRRRLGFFAGIGVDNFKMTIDYYHLYTNSNASVTIFLSISGYVEIGYTNEPKLGYRAFDTEEQSLETSIDVELFDLSSIDVWLTLHCAMESNSKGQADSFSIYDMQAS
jgi:hypothetical protein